MYPPSSSLKFINFFKKTVRTCPATSVANSELYSDPNSILEGLTGNQIEVACKAGFQPGGTLICDWKTERFVGMDSGGAPIVCEPPGEEGSATSFSPVSTEGRDLDLQNQLQNVLDNAWMRGASSPTISEGKYLKDEQIGVTVSLGANEGNGILSCRITVRI